MGGGVALGFSIYNSYADQLPDASFIEQQQDDFQTVRIYDRTGQHLLYESVDPRPFRGDRTFIPLDEMSPWVWKAAVALEDRNFCENSGINVRGLLRAFVSNAQGGAVQGGSSITQQLIKNVIIPVEERTQQSYARKIKEVILALEVTRRYPKEKILEWYLNYNFYGNLAYGVEAASQVYFGKSSADLTLAEAAMLAAIPQFPALNPIDNPEDADFRQGLALNAMVEAGYITQAEADAAFAEPLTTLRKSVAERFDILTAPHFALYVLERIKDEFNTADDPYFIWRKGLEVYTTLDVDLQHYAEQVAREQVALLAEQGKNASNAAVVVIRNDTGEVLAMVGSLDYNNEKIDGQVNVATAERQPGSSFKPFVYLTAHRRRHDAGQHDPGRGDGLSPGRRHLLPPGELRPPISRPHVAAQRAGALLQHPRGARAQGRGRGRCVAHGAQAGHQRPQPWPRLLWAEPGAGRRRGDAAGSHLRLLRAGQRRRDDRRAGSAPNNCAPASAI